MIARATCRPIPKNKRAADKKLAKRMKEEIGCCERCGSTKYLEWAHIKSKGSGGPDIPQNGVVLCGPASMGMGCHGLEHKGKIDKEELWKLAARREGIGVEECKAIVREDMGYA